MKYSNSIIGDQITAFADASLFSKEAILKCLYWYGDKFHTTINLLDDSIYCINLKPLNSILLKENEPEFYLQKLERDIIDFQLRDVISKQTGNIRDLLVAKAFSNGQFDEEPPGEISDPVGFNPVDIR